MTLVVEHAAECSSDAVTSRMRFDCEPTVCDQERVAPVAAEVVATVAMSTDGDPAGALSTVTVIGEESVVFPTLSVVRATIVYVPFAGWPFHGSE